MSVGDAGHDAWAQLAVGHALDALEPADEAVFLAHVRTCPSCQRLVDDTRRSATELAYAVEPVAPPPQLWARIEAGLGQSGRPPAAVPVPAAPGPAIGPARRSGLRWLAAAAAAAVLAGLVGTGVLASRLSGQNSTQRRQLAAVLDCLGSPDCRLMPMTGSGGAQAVALVSSGRVQLFLNGLPQNNRGAEVYVLWELRGGAPPAAVTTFDVVTGGWTAVPARALPVAATAQSALAVTREAGRQAPPRPAGPTVLSAAAVK